MGKEVYTSLPVTQTQESIPVNSTRWGKKTLASIALSSLLILSYTDVIPTLSDLIYTTDGAYISSSCHQAEPLLPTLFDPKSVISGQEGKIRDWLSGAVRVQTEMFDVMGPIGEDKRWDVFYNFSDCK
jgi:Gly-Xaa carboxypeptidase